MDFINAGNRPVLVTGANGFVGKYVIGALKEAGIRSDKVVGLTRKKEAEIPYGQQHVFNLQNFGQIEEVVKLHRPVAVIHLAAVAETRLANASPDHAWRINFEATRILAQAMVRWVPDAKLVFAGSGEAYGSTFRSNSKPIQEDQPLNPNSVYAATKAAADVMLGQLKRTGFDVVRFRSFNHTGVGQETNYVVPAFASQVAMIEHLLIPPKMLVGNLEVQRDFLDVRDVANAYVGVLSVAAHELPDTAINLSSGTLRSVKSILKSVLDLSSSNIFVEVDPKRLRKNEVPVAGGDNSLLKSTLDWQPKYDLRDTIESILNQFRELYGRV